MSSIGGYTVYILGGTLDQVGIQTTELIRPGIDGHGFRDEGMRSAPTNIQAMYYYADDSTASTAITNFKDLEGTIITYIDERGVTYDNVLLRKVIVGETPLSPMFVASAVSGSKVLVNYTFILHNFALE